jgi:hypothetical protein
MYTNNTITIKINNNSTEERVINQGFLLIPTNIYIHTCTHTHTHTHIYIYIYIYIYIHTSIKDNQTCE